MPSSFARRTATKVKDGRVQRKNRAQPTGLGGYVLERKSPARGFRHVVSKRDVQAFIDIIPEWPRLSQRLESISLSCATEAGNAHYAFYHREETGAIYLHAWPEDLWVELEPSFFEAHEAIFERFGVASERFEEHVICRFTDAQARAFMLLHVFMHELGHHHDRLHQKHRGSSKGEDYAERFANSRFEQLFPAYVGVFGDPKG